MTIRLKDRCCFLQRVTDGNLHRVGTPDLVIEPSCLKYIGKLCLRVLLCLFMHYVCKNMHRCECVYIYECSYASVHYAQKCVCKHCVCIMNAYTCMRISIYVCRTVYHILSCVFIV